MSFLYNIILQVGYSKICFINNFRGGGEALNKKVPLGGKTLNAPLDAQIGAHNYRCLMFKCSSLKAYQYVYRVSTTAPGACPAFFGSIF